MPSGSHEEKNYMILFGTDVYASMKRVQPFSLLKRWKRDPVVNGFGLEMVTNPAILNMFIYE